MLDCNDLDAVINRSAEDIPNNGIDEYCDNMDNTTVFTVVPFKEKVTKTILITR